MTAVIPEELLRAESLMHELGRAAALARHYGADRVQFDIESAEELVQLLADSLRATKHISGLQEWDGTIEPQRMVPRA